MTRRELIASIAILGTLGIALVGCASGASISSTDALVSAYTDAGGTCETRTETAVDEIGTRVSCDGTDLVLIAGENALEEFDGSWVVGNGWIARISDEIGEKMGGIPSMCTRGSGCTPAS